MPKLDRFFCKERVKAYNVTLHALQLELDDPENGRHETQTEMRYLRDKLRRERDRFAAHHNVPV